MKTFQRHIAFLLLAIFSFVQLVELHVWEDLDLHEHCTLCDMADLAQADFTWSSNTIVLENTTKPSFVDPVFGSDTNKDLQTSTLKLRNKAPPIV